MFTGKNGKGLHDIKLLTVRGSNTLYQKIPSFGLLASFVEISQVAKAL
jgi:hypothetical protein